MDANQQPQASEGQSGSGIEGTRGAEVSADPGSNYLISVQIDEQYEDKLDCDALHRLALAVLHSERAPGPLEVGVVVTTDEEVLALNRQYLGHDYKTDVLSFGMQQGHSSEDRIEFVTPQERPAYLGDVVISYDRAAEQAPEYGQSTEAEVATLLIHGLLHLLGYDDMAEGTRRRMHARQQELLEALYDPEC
jgi:probable rRNA maturation factor